MSFPDSHARSTRRFGVLVLFLLAASFGVTSIAEAQPTLGGSSSPRVTVTKTPQGPDRGYYYQVHSHADLKSISELILKLTAQLVRLLDSPGSHDGRTMVDYEALRKLAAIKEAVRERRRLQETMLLEQLFLDVEKQEAEAANSSGREPTKPEAERRAAEIENQVEQQRARIDESGAGEAAPAEAPPPPTTPPPPAPGNKPAVTEAK